jgi:hypothetical protein
MLKHLKMIPCCVTPQQHAALKALSKRTGVPIQDYLREAVADVLVKRDGPRAAEQAGHIAAQDSPPRNRCSICATGLRACPSSTGSPQTLYDFSTLFE